jgi:hypothetical protein
LSEAIDRLYDLQNYPFTALELSPTVDEEQVAEVFVRINSKGTILNQADFILTLMSVFWDEGRAELERFCGEARQPSTSGASPIERHHLFPKGYLAKLGIKELPHTNQIANYALVEWSDNIHIADHSPAEYFPRYAERFSAEELSQMCYWHALPTGWEQMDYREFIETRRQCMAAVIREGFKQLGE